MRAINFGLLQAASVLITIIVYLQFKTTTAWLSFLYAFSFAHYILAVYYSRRNIAAKRNNSKTWVPLILLAIFGVYIYETAFSLVVYFGAHHVINDVYNRFNHTTVDKTKINLQLITASALLCNGLGWLTILHGSESFFSLPSRWVYVGIFVLFFLLHIVILACQKVENKKEFILSNISSELIYLCIIPLSFMYKIDLYHVIFYHGVVWGLLPLFKQNTLQNVAYISSTTLLILVFLMLSPIGLREMKMSATDYLWMFQAFTYFHITLAFATSSAHPVWINRFFGNRLQY